MGREMTMQALQRQHFTSHPEPTQDGEEAIRSSRKASKPELGQDGHMPASATQRTLRGTHTGVRARPQRTLRGTHTVPSHPEPTQDGKEAIRPSRKASKPELGQDGHIPCTSGDRRGPADSARKSAATKPRSRAHVWANRFPMRFYLIAAVCVVLLQCHPVSASGRCPCCNENREYCLLLNGEHKKHTCRFCNVN